MSMDLHNGNGSFYVSTFTWCKVLRLGQELGGWQPMGVRVNWEFQKRSIEHLPEEEQAIILANVTPGKYFLNDWDIMLGKDAENLANALEAVMDDIPTISIDHGTTVLEYFSGKESRAWLESLIAYLSDGGDVVLG